MDYKVVKYSEIGKIRSGKRLPKGYTVSEEISDNKYIRVRDINNGSIDSSIVQYITDEAAEKLERYRVKTRDIIISVVGTIGAIAQIDESLDGAYLTENCDNLQVDESICLKDYLKYYLLSEYGNKEIIANTVGSTQPKLPIYGIDNFNIKLPSIDKQKRIVKLLNSIDEKVKLNNEINNNLSEQIKYIYNDIFIDYANYKRLDEISNVTIGKTPPRSEQECFTTNKNDVKWVSISDLGKSGMFIFDTSEKLTQEAVDKYNVKVIPKDTVILSFKLTVGRTGFTTEDMTTNEAIAHFDLNNKELNNYLYCTLTYFNYSDLGSTSSIATAINSKIVKSIKIGIPSDEQLNKFNNLTSAMFKTIKNNESENIKLSDLRDTLLPKLMNGEIDLDNIEI